MKKKIISLGLTSTILMGTVAFAGGTDSDIMLISENPIQEVIDQQVKQAGYMNYKGEITNVSREDGKVSITVDSLDEKDNYETIIFHISEDALLLSDDTQDIIKDEKLKEGSVVEVFYGENTPMTMSIPPQTTPEVIVLKELKDDSPQVTVDRFNEELVDTDNLLKLNITKDTVMIDKQAKQLQEKDLYNKNLVAFYGPATSKSIPAQGNAVKVIVLDQEDVEVSVFDKVIYNGKQIKLKNKMYKSQDVLMMPIREVAESLGYKVGWNNTTRQAELTKGAQYLTATANQDMYSKAKMIVKLGKASELKAGTTFVPVSFIEEVMDLEIEVNQDGVIGIK